MKLVGRRTLLSIHVWTKLINTAVIISTDPHRLLNGFNRFTIVKDPEGRKIVVPEIMIRQCVFLRPPPCRGLDVDGYFAAVGLPELAQTPTYQGHMQLVLMGAYRPIVFVKGAGRCCINGTINNHGQANTHLRTWTQWLLVDTQSV